MSTCLITTKQLHNNTYKTAKKNNHSVNNIMKKIAASASMKSFMEFFTCCGPRPSGSSRSAEDTRSLVAPGPRRSISGRLEGVIDNLSWKPSLCSISEDDIFMEASGDTGQPAAERWRSLQKQVSSSPQRDRGHSSKSSHVRRAPVSTVVRPLVPSRSFMF